MGNINNCNNNDRRTNLLLYPCCASVPGVTICIAVCTPHPLACNTLMIIIRGISDPAWIMMTMMTVDYRMELCYVQSVEAPMKEPRIYPCPRLVENGAATDWCEPLNSSFHSGFVYYRRSGFNCEILLNANCEFFKSSQLIDSQE